MRIYLTGKKDIADDLFMLIDDIDADLTKTLWHSNGENTYAIGIWPHRSKTHRPRFVHRVILERMIGRRLHSKEFVDHINQNKLDNRRDNLRLCTHQQNKWNTVKSSSRTDIPFTSQYKGVSLFRKNGKWTAAIKINGKSKRLGYFFSEEEAARAYDAAAREHFGEFACTNFPETVYEIIDKVERNPVNGDLVIISDKTMRKFAETLPIISDETPLTFKDY